MEYLKETNLSKYKLNIDCHFNYCFVKINNVYEYKNIINDNKNDNYFEKNEDNILIKSFYEYDNQNIENIKNYCKKSKYDFIMKDINKQYYQNLNKTITNYYHIQFNSMFQNFTDISYLKEVNVVDKINDDYIGYFNIYSYIKSINFPLLNKYNYEVNYSNILSYKKEFIHYDMIDSNNNKITNITVDINKNKCILSLSINKNNLTNKDLNLINKEILNLTDNDKLNINLDDNFLKQILNNKILN